MRSKKLQTTLLILVGPILLGVGAMFVLSLTASRPDNLGVRNGRLAEAPESPNCVSTQATTDYHRIDPLTFEGDGGAAISTLKSVVEKLSGSTVIEESPTYLYAEFCSTFFRFVDDVEFHLDAESRTIHFRSASRVGRSDLGVNRTRMERIRTLFAEAMQ